DQLQTVPPPIGEDEHVPAQRVRLQPLAHQTVQPLETFAHVRRPRRQIDARRRPPAEHASAPFDHAPQRAERRRVEPALYFNPPPARQHHRHAAGARYRWRRRAGDVHRHPAVRARAAALPLPQTFPVRIQRRDLQPAPLAEYPPAQPARRKLPRQLLGLTRRAPPSCTRLLFAHPSTQTSPPQIGKMGWSDGYHKSDLLGAYWDWSLRRRSGRMKDVTTQLCNCYRRSFP